MLALNACQWELDRINPDCPTVSTIEPTSASAGETVTISGSNFLFDAADNYQVLLNGALVEVSQRIDESTLQIVVPEEISIGSLSGDLQISLANQECDTVAGNARVSFTYRYKATDVELLAGVPGETDCENCLNQPSGIDVYNNGNEISIFVTDKAHSIIRVISDNGAILETIGMLNSPGCGNFTNGDFAQFADPSDVAVDPENGQVFITDRGSSVVSNISSSNTRAVNVIAGDCQNGFGCMEGASGLLTSKFRFMVGIAFSNNQIFVADESCHNVYQINLNDQLVTRVLGNGSPGNGVGQLRNPAGIDYFQSSATELLFVADKSNGRVLLLENGEISTLFDQGNSLNTPIDVAYDGVNTLFILDEGKSQIFAGELDTKNLYLIAGSGNEAFGSGNGNPLLASFNRPNGLCFDRTSKTIYVADTRNQVIRKIPLQ